MSGGLPTPVPVDTSTLPGSVTGVARQGAPLLSVWCPLLVGLAAVVALALLTRRLRRRHRSRPGGLVGRSVSVTAGGAVVALVVVTVAAAVNAYAGYLPTWRSAARFLTGRSDVSVASNSGDVAVRALDHQPGGAAAVAAGDTRWTVSDIHTSDASLDIRDRQVLIALPPGYRSGRRDYPVLYLLSGFPGRAQDWFVSGRITQTLDALAAAGRSRYYICVAPDVNGSFLTDSETLDAVRGPQVQTWLTRDVVDYVDAHYRAVPSRGGRVLAGMSSGGYAALNVALRHQDEFGVSLAMEPYGDPGNVTHRLLGGQVGLLRANSPSYYAPSETLHRSLPTFLDVGSDGDVAQVDALAAVLAQRHEPVEVRVETGQRHTWSEASAGLPYALAFAERQLDDPRPLALSYPPQMFPPAGRDKYGTTVSPDAQAALHQQLVCDALIRRAGNTQAFVPEDCAPVDRSCSGEELQHLPPRLTGAYLQRLCPTRKQPPATRTPAGATAGAATAPVPSTSETAQDPPPH